MLVKQKRFKVSSGTLFGIGGGAFLVLTGVLMVASPSMDGAVPACEARYPSAGQFALERSSGRLLDSATLQAKLGGSDWGLIDNVSVGRAERNSAVMQVKFAAGGAFEPSRRTASGGFGFDWRPGYVAAASSACLSYSIRLPSDFDFGAGGTLPGLFGEASVPGRDGEHAFSARMRWLPEGKVGVQPVTVNNRQSKLVPVDPNWLTLRRGEWVSIEQEVVLNDPGQENGRVRVWVDGKLRLDRDNVMFRESDDVRINGVIADTHYADKAMVWQAAPSDARIEISPFIVRWE